MVGNGGNIGIGDGEVGRGFNVAGTDSEDTSAGAGVDLTGDSLGVGVGGDSVVKAPEALQALRVLLLMALTFQ